MTLADAAIRRIVDSVEFRASAAPYLLVDADLRIRGANLAYQRATLHDSSDITGEPMFDVFPDNPATPEARGVERLGTSFEQVLATGQPHRMEIQRYDVLAGPGEFVEKNWLPRNVPVRDADGRTVAVLHHVEDVTHLVVATALERHLVARSGSLAAPGTTYLVDELVRDSLARKARAQMLMHGSHRAVERASRRIEGADRR